MCVCAEKGSCVFVCVHVCTYVHERKTPVHIKLKHSSKPNQPNQKLPSVNWTSAGGRLSYLMPKCQPDAESKALLASTPGKCSDWQLCHNLFSPPPILLPQGECESLRVSTWVEIEADTERGRQQGQRPLLLKLQIFGESSSLRESPLSA